MKALCWHGRYDVRVDDVPEPAIRDPRDAIVKVSTAAICGSDLHLYHGYIPTMKAGDILGHEFVGHVVTLGAAVSNLREGERVLVPFNISCGDCFFCRRALWALCDRSNPNAGLAAKLYGYAPGGLFGYSHLMGGYAGAQAEYVRVPFADVGAFTVPDDLSDEQVLFLTDILPTAYMAAENARIQRGDTVAVWGCGPVGQLTIKCAYLLGAERVIAIDHVPERLRLAQACGGAETINFDEVPVLDTLKAMTGGRGPDACIDAVGLEAHGRSLDAIYDQVKAAMYLATDRPHALREAIQACRKGGTVSVPGVYGGFLDKFNFGAAFAKGLTLIMGQTHTHRYVRPLMTGRWRRPAARLVLAQRRRQRRCGGKGIELMSLSRARGTGQGRMSLTNARDKSKDMLWPSPERRRLLGRLQMEVADLRRRLAEVRTETQQLLAIEESRPLSGDEAARARALARESEHLRWELRRLYLEFESLRAPR